VTISVVDWDDPASKRLRDAQQAELKDLYGEDDIGHEMTGDEIAVMVLVHVDDEPVACGAVRDLGDGVGELKRMFVTPAARGRGLSRQVVAELERLALERGFHRLVLETGVLQVAAIGLYLAAGYRSIPNFGEYAAETASRCFAKDLLAEPRVRGPKHPGTLTLRRVAWDHPDAVALRYRMWLDIEVRYPEGSGELKKVWVDDEARGAGAARALLAAIEEDARAAGLTSVVLQTGIRQPEAVTLYLSAGYRPIAPFGPYTDDFLSLLFGKDL
jgi:GNAT superfamily N-acetyltransferase